MTYIRTMGEALRNYHNINQQIEKTIEQVRSQYGDEAAALESNRLSARRRDARQTAEAEIEKAYTAGITEAESWGTLKGSQITDDMKLLEAGLVDNVAFEDLKKRYKDNPTMLIALKKYGIRKNNETLQSGADLLAANAKRFVTEDIIDRDSMLKTAEIMLKRVRTTLDMIDGTGDYSGENHVVGRAMVDEMMKLFE